MRPIVRLLCVGLLAAVGAPAASQQPAPARPSIAAQRPPVRPAASVDWQAAVGGLRQSGNLAPRAAANLDPGQVDITRMPILLPNDLDLTARARIYSFGDQYTISADIPGGGVSLTGTTTVIPLPPTSRLTLPTVAEDLVIQRTVDGQLASFTRFGVLYSVEVRCDSPKDARCRTEAYVRQLLARTTIVVMGKAARQAAGLGA